MKSKMAYTILVLQLFLALGCGQDRVVIPDRAEGSICGDWYPGGERAENDTMGSFGMSPGDTFPCLVFETARLAGEDTYINMGDLYLGSKHGETDTRAVVIIIGADNCPACAVLIEEITSMANAFDAAGALMIGAAWCDNIDATDCDFDLDRAETVLKYEGWLIERWLITNDQEGHLRPSFSSVYPTAIVVELKNMKVRAVENAPDAADLLALVQSFAP